MLSIPSPSQHPLTHRQAAIAALPLVLRDGERAVTQDLLTVRPVPTRYGACASSLAELQAALPRLTEARLLRRLDAASNPGPVAMAAIWRWASPGTQTETPIDDLAIDRSAIACLLWPHSGENLLAAMRHSERAVFDLLLGAFQEASLRTATTPAARARWAHIGRRVDAMQAHAVAAAYPERTLLASMLIAWNAPRTLTPEELVQLARRADDDFCRSGVPSADAHMLLLRLHVRAAQSGGQTVFLREMLPTFLQATKELQGGDAQLSYDASYTPMRLLLRLQDAMHSVAGADAIALGQDIARLPWPDDAASVRAPVALWLCELAPPLRRQALERLSCPATRRALSQAAAPQGASMQGGAEVLVHARIAVVCAAASMALADLQGGRPQRPNAVALCADEFMHIAGSATDRAEAARMALRCHSPRKASGLRTLSIFGASQFSAGQEILPLLKMAAMRRQAISGQGMLGLLAACRRARPCGEVANKEATENLLIASLCRLLRSQLPDPPFMVRFLVEAFLGTDACPDHAPLSAGTILERFDGMAKLLDGCTSDGERSALCALVGEAVRGVACRASAIALSVRTAQLSGTAKLSLVTKLADTPDFAAWEPTHRLALIDTLAAQAGDARAVAPVRVCGTPMGRPEAPEAPGSAARPPATEDKGKATDTRSGPTWGQGEADGPHLRAALRRRLRQQDPQVLEAVLEDCVRTLAHWSTRIDCTSADANLEAAEAAVLLGAAATLGRWRGRRAPKKAESAPLRYGAALAWRALGPKPAQPYWALAEPERDLYRAFFGTLVGMGLGARLGSAADRPLAQATQRRSWSAVVAQFIMQLEGGPLH